jgi:hypothetical protein
MAQDIYQHKKTGFRYIQTSDQDLQLNGMYYSVISLFSGGGGFDTG